MKKNLTILLAAAAVLSACGTEPQKSDTVALFNGEDLTGWQLYIEDSTKNAAEEFVVRDGEIALSGTFGYVRTETPYDNYRLSVEWCWPDSATNSGIFVHLQKDGIWPSCYECQLWNGRAGDIINSGGADSEQYRSDSTQMIVAKTNPSNEKPQGEWNTAEIVCSGDSVTVYINGELQNRITGISNREGYIGLQSEGGPIRFRNVNLTPLE